MGRTIFNYLCGAALLCSVAGAHAQADHLLLSEVGMAPPNAAQLEGFSSEFVEIYNPTASPIPLDNYYFADTMEYWKMPTGISLTGATDNIVRFPAGAVLQPGQYAVITGGGYNFLEYNFGENVTYDDFRNLPGQPLLFEVAETDPDIPNMTYFNTGSLPTNFNLTNAAASNGELAVLFYWDGVSDLVQDVDIVAWGDSPSANRFIPKTAGDFGANGTPYLPDAGDHTNLTLGAGFTLIHRVLMTEPGEVLTGGNGLTGHDETTEQATLAWVGANFADNAQTPGLPYDPPASQSPVIASAVRDVQYPDPGEDVTITVEASDPDGTVESVTVYVRTDDTFTAVNAVEGDPGVWTANIGSFANNTVVDYFVEATDDTNTTARLPRHAPMSGLTNGFHVTDSPLQPGDIIFNEILFDNPSSDTFEYVELYNRSADPIDLSFFGITDASNNYRWLPRGAVIEGNSYMVLTMNVGELRRNYDFVPGIPYYDWGTFALNQGGDTIYLAHANEFGTASNPTETSYVSEVTYGTSAPWPNSADFGGSLRSLELKHPSLDPNNGANWGVAIEKGTPGAQNTVYTGGVVISNVNRDLEFPVLDTPIVISADVEHVLGGSVTSVRAMIDTGAGFTPFPMTESSTPGTYEVTLPGFSARTIVKFYIEATDGSVTETEPISAPAETYLFIVDASFPTSDDLVINEILYDNIGSDAYEYVEIYNRNSSPIRLDYIRVGDPTPNYFEFPEGAEIAGNGFVVLTMSISDLTMQYSVPGDVPMFNVNYVLNNPSDTVYIAHPNSIDFQGTTTYIDVVTYNNVAPWPEIDANATGQSIELLSPELDNSLGQNWGAAVLVGPYPGSGTPGLPNTAEGSNVADWNLY